jgi:UDP-N-acetyl-D-glucosamine dehydrogenase
VAELLVQLGADVRVADPLVTERPRSLPSVTMVECSREEVAEADAVVILTDHDHFDYDMIYAAASYVLDTRRRLEPGGPTEVL